MHSILLGCPVEPRSQAGYRCSHSLVAQDDEIMAELGEPSDTFKRVLDAGNQLGGRLVVSTQIGSSRKFLTNHLVGSEDVHDHPVTPGLEWGWRIDALQNLRQILTRSEPPRSHRASHHPVDPEAAPVIWAWIEGDQYPTPIPGDQAMGFHRPRGLLSVSIHVVEG